MMSHSQRPRAPADTRGAHARTPLASARVSRAEAAPGVRASDVIQLQARTWSFLFISRQFTSSLLIAALYITTVCVMFPRPCA